MGFYQNVDIYGYLLGLHLSQECAVHCRTQFCPIDL